MFSPTHLWTLTTICTVMIKHSTGRARRPLFTGRGTSRQTVFVDLFLDPWRPFLPWRSGFMALHNVVFFFKSRREGFFTWLQHGGEVSFPGHRVSKCRKKTTWLFWSFAEEVSALIQDASSVQDERSSRLPSALRYAIVALESQFCL